MRIPTLEHHPQLNWIHDTTGSTHHLDASPSWCHLFPPSPAAVAATSIPPSSFPSQAMMRNNIRTLLESVSFQSFQPPIGPSYPLDVFEDTDDLKHAPANPPLSLPYGNYYDTLEPEQLIQTPSPPSPPSYPPSSHGVGSSLVTLDGTHKLSSSNAPHSTGAPPPPLNIPSFGSFNRSASLGSSSGSGSWSTSSSTASSSFFPTSPSPTSSCHFDHNYGSSPSPPSVALTPHLVHEKENRNLDDDIIDGDIAMSFLPSTSPSPSSCVRSHGRKQVDFNLPPIESLKRGLVQYPIQFTNPFASGHVLQIKQEPASPSPSPIPIASSSSSCPGASSSLDKVYDREADDVCSPLRAILTPSIVSKGKRKSNNQNKNRVRNISLSTEGSVSSHDEGFASQMEEDEWESDVHSDSDDDSFYGDYEAKDLLNARTCEDPDNRWSLTMGRPRKSSTSRYFWQYNVQSKGQKGPRSPHLDDPCLSDPFSLPEASDPVFSPECRVEGVKHAGKARKGDGNDLTPKPRKLLMIGLELKKLSKTINDLTPVAEVPISAKGKTRKEKNKLASRACRLKKKAQHEANKIKLCGLEQEHKQVLQLLDQMKGSFKASLARSSLSGSAVKFAPFAKKLIREHTIPPVAGFTAQFVNRVLDNVASGQTDGGLNTMSSQ